MATSVEPTTGSEASVLSATVGGEAAAAKVPVPSNANEYNSPAAKQERRDAALALAAKNAIPGSETAPVLTQAETDAALALAKLKAQDPMAAAAAEAAAATETVEATTTDAETADDGQPDKNASNDSAGTLSTEAEGIVVELPAIKGKSDVPISLTVGDQETADYITAITQQAARVDRAEAIREEAQTLRQETEDFNYVVEMDPAGVIIQTLLEAPPGRAETPAEQQLRAQDAEHLFRYLATQPGVLDRNADWVKDLLDGKKNVADEGKFAELERKNRKDAVSKEVANRRAYQDYKREVSRTVLKSIDSLVPETMKDEGRRFLYDQTLDQAIQYHRANKISTTDLLRQIPGMIQKRFADLGVPLKAGNQTGSEGPAAPAKRTASKVGAPVAAAASTETKVTPKTAAELKAASVNRQAAASAPAGPGGVATALPQRPAYDPAKPGNAIQQSVKWAKEHLLPSLGKKPS